MNLLKNKFNIILSGFLLIQIVYSQDLLKGKIVFQVKWGYQSENVLLKIQDFEPWGVRDFWTYDDAYFYIMDTMNKQVKKFSKKGDLIWVTDVKYSPIYVWELSDSTIIILNTAWNQKYQILKLDTTGNILNISPLIKMPNSYINAILTVSKENIYVQTQKNAVRLDHELSILDEIKISPNVKLAFYIYSDSIFPIKFRNFQPNPFVKIYQSLEYNSRIYLNEESFSEGITIETKDDLQSFEGMDSLGNFYLKRVSKGNNKDIVIKLSPHRELISEKHIQFKTFHVTGFRLKIMPKGDIYTQNSDKEKYWIEKYPAEWFDK